MASTDPPSPEHPADQRQASRESGADDHVLVSPTRLARPRYLRRDSQLSQPRVRAPGTVACPAARPGFGKRNATAGPRLAVVTRLRSGWPRRPLADTGATLATHVPEPVSPEPPLGDQLPVRAGDQTAARPRSGREVAGGRQPHARGS
jgi:hypothetical protein